MPLLVITATPGIPCPPFELAPQRCTLTPPGAYQLVPRAHIARSVSCSKVEVAPNVSISRRRNSQYGGMAMPPARLNISYEDEALCLRSSENVYRLFEDATSNPINSADNSRLFARKALRYRNLLARVDQANLSDPTFDVADFCGVTWLKRTKSATVNSL